MSLRMKLGVTVAALAFAGAALAQTPAAKPSRIRGDIVSVSGDKLTVHRRSGDTVTIESARNSSRSCAAEPARQSASRLLSPKPSKAPAVASDSQ